MNNAAPLGSSPHARGARRKPRPRRMVHGLIPACAGSTAAVPAGTRPRWAHPRMRGEHRGEASTGSRLRGSSPHARGAREGAPQAGPAPRLIPACAGSTSTADRMIREARAHPRMRGEHPC